MHHRSLAEYGLTRSATRDTVLVLASKRCLQMRRASVVKKIAKASVGRLQ
jgi:hypothetical protein